jgi:hypothetical protein
MAVLTAHNKVFEVAKSAPADPPRLSGVLGRLLNFPRVESGSGREAAGAVKDIEEVVAAAQVVRELHHLETQPAGAQAFRGEHNERLDDHSSTCQVQCFPRNHHYPKNVLVCWSIGSGSSAKAARQSPITSTTPRYA